MRYRLPENCAGVSVAGLALEPDKTGTVEADTVVAEGLAPHGILPVEERVAASPPAEAPPKRRGRP